jgi:putative DNA primase/helicase
MSPPDDNVVNLRPEAPAVEPGRPEYRVYDHPVTLNSSKLRAGVWYHGNREDKSTGERLPFDEWLCGPLHVEAVTRNEGQDGDYGRLLRFRNADNRWLTWAMPNELLAGKPDVILAVLLNMGLEVDYKRKAQVPQYIACQHPKRRVIAATSTGWYTPELFIMPRQNIGRGDAIFQSEAANGDDYRHGGTLAGWRENIGARCEGNPLLVLSVCASLAGALLFHVQRQGGGFHIVGDSSTGKSSAILAGASVWGHGDDFKRTWRATGNGLEGIASQRNDTLLALDEIGEADPREIGAVVYAMANGTGKARASRNGSARPAKRWRIILFSSGELSLSAIMAEGGKRSRAGQEIRLLDIPARRAFGAWDNLHGLAGGREFSDAIQRASVTDYGHAGPEFIRQLLASGDADKLPAWLASMAAKFPSTSGQEGRGAERFALVALAGELAIKFGILSIPPGSVQTAMLEMFDVWRAGRGEGPSEDRQILKSIADFIDRHGGSRFQSVNAGADVVRDRAGYWEDAPSGRLYLFTRSGLEEAANGYDLSRVVMALDSVGAITKREAGRAQVTKRLPDGTRPKLYFIDPAKLEPET